MGKPVITIQTDFGVGGGSAMRGTCLKVDPELEVYEITHSVEKFNIRTAARNLRNIVPYWPQGTVFVSVIDPGVGTARKASVALLKNGSYVVTPDNGTLTLLLDTIGVEAVREIDGNVNRLKGTENVSIFHGRDLFAYCAAKLASGIIDFEGVGPEYPVSEIIRYTEPGFTVTEGAVSGSVTGMMRTFGNIETGIPIEAAQRAGLKEGRNVRVTISSDAGVAYDRVIPYRPSFGWVPEGEDVLYNSSDGVLGIGINLGNFSEKYGIVPSDDWTITVRDDSFTSEL